MLCDRTLAAPLLCLAVLGAALAPGSWGLAQERGVTPPANLRPGDPCSGELPVLVTQLLRDLPSYANRVASRSRPRPAGETEDFTSVLVASAPDFTPIDLASLTPSGGEPWAGPDSALQQVFFTTLERQYRANRAVSLQNHHWLFLAQSSDGWRLALLYSSLDIYPAHRRAPTPPQESSDGIIGQAVRLWLRDCRAGAVLPPAPTDDAAAGSTAGPTSP